MDCWNILVSNCGDMVISFKEPPDLGITSSPQGDLIIAYQDYESEYDMLTGRDALIFDAAAMTIVPKDDISSNRLVV